MLNSPSTKSIQILHETVSRRNAERAQTMQMLARFKKDHLTVRDERDRAQAELVRLKDMLAKTQAENARLVKRERELAQEVSMMAAAIDVANREIAEADMMIMDAAAAVEAEFVSGAEARPVSAPQVKLKAEPQAPQRAQAQAIQQAKQGAQTSQQRKPAQPHAVQQTSQQQKPQDSRVQEVPQATVGVAAKMPSAELPDELAESFEDIERMLEESLKGAA